MGITRKTLSVCTFGLIDFRSDKERMARSGRQAAKEAKEQTKIMRDQAKRDRER